MVAYAMMEVEQGEHGDNTSFVPHQLDILDYAKWTESCCEHVDLHSTYTTLPMPSTQVHQSSGSMIRQYLGCLSANHKEPCEILHFPQLLVYLAGQQATLWRGCSL